VRASSAVSDQHKRLLNQWQNLIRFPACDRPSDKGFEEFEAEVAKHFPNTKVIGYPFNVAKEDETLGLIDEVLNSWGRLDVWVSSSGLLGPPSLEATTPADLQRCFEANSMAPFFALKYAPPAMGKTTPKQAYPNAAPKDQKYGSIIVVSSVASTYGGKGCGERRHVQ
jgi:NAD(P)-dependent dehydrogenase (short-subunit alcohol dehydrogenase family)